MSTVTVNHIYNLICVLAAIFAALPPSVINVLPTQAKPYIVLIAGLLMAIKSNWNFQVNPDGTPAKVAYRPDLAAKQ